MDLTIIGLIIAVVGIVLQIADAFPEHREVRKTIVILSCGVFLGMLASGFAGAHYNITGNVDRQFALLFTLAGIAVLFALFAVFVVEEKKRTAAGTAAGMAFCAFIIVGFAVVLGTFPKSYDYSSEELLLLAATAERQGQYDRAIERLHALEEKLTNADAQAAVSRRIAKLEAVQGGIASH
jgi:cytochrome bd-type quinol oxidase subunit 2